MNILSIPIDVPWPADSGGRVDVWRRLVQWRAAGARVSLLSWHDPVRQPTDLQAQDRALREVVHDHRLFPIHRSPRSLVQRLCWTGRAPSHAASRWIALGSQRDDVLAWARAQQPDVVVLDGLYGAVVARWLATALGVPLVYRAHNIEHRYMRQQWAKSAWGLGRLGLALNLLGLQGFETRVIHDAFATLDISLDDLQWWRDQGLQRLHWLPTSVDAHFARRLSEPEPPTIDLLYFGNLHTPNNIDAVTWLVSEVLPRMRTPGPLKVVLAGSQPSDALRRWLAGHPGVQLMASPPDMASVVRRARVLVNPLRAGSGVNLKSVEMLFSQAALVATPLAVRGLPPEVQACFELASDAGTLAQRLDQSLVSPPSGPELARRAALRPVFDGSGGLQQLAALLALRPENPGPGR